MEIFVSLYCFEGENSLKSTHTWKDVHSIISVLSVISLHIVSIACAHKLFNLIIFHARKLDELESNSNTHKERENDTKTF